MDRPKHWNARPVQWHKRQKPLAREMRREPTEAEQILWERLRRRQLRGFHFRRQHPIGHYIVDFYCAAALLAIEVDGGVHARADHAASDRLRSEGLRQLGVRVLRFSNEDVLQRIDWVVERVEAALDAR